MPPDGLIRVQTDVVLDVLVGSIHAAAAERATGEGVARIESIGWHAREVELERFAAAREAMPWLAERLAAGDGRPDPDAVSRALAAEEPLERPDPRETPSWRVPGPGGHVRHYLALRALDDVPPLVDGGALRYKRAWMTGFLRHCCEEVLAGRPDTMGAA